MKKREKEYLDKYGSISKDYMERFSDLLQELRIKNKDLVKLRDAIPALLDKKWNKVDFIFYMVPKSTPRPRSNFNTKVFYVKNAADNSSLFNEFIESCDDMQFSICTPTRFYVEIFLPTPSNMSRIEKICAELKLLFHISKPDFDNLAKTYSDMIQGRFLIDDSLIVDGRIRKFYSVKPRIEIHMEFMDKFDCKYNKKKVESWSSYQSLDIDEKDSII